MPCDRWVPALTELQETACRRGSHLLCPATQGPRREQSADVWTSDQWPLGLWHGSCGEEPGRRAPGTGCSDCVSEGLCGRPPCVRRPQQSKGLPREAGCWGSVGTTWFYSGRRADISETWRGGGEQAVPEGERDRFGRTVFRRLLRPASGTAGICLGCGHFGFLSAELSLGL